jgi:hypothetical protein
MTRRNIAGILIVVLLALGGFAIAQQERPIVPAGALEAGLFTVSAAGESAVLLETKSGKTWVLQRSVEGESAWLPAKRLDSDDDILNWRKREREIELIRAREARRALEESLKPKK